MGEAFPAGLFKCGHAEEILLRLGSVPLPPTDPSKTTSHYFCGPYRLQMGGYAKGELYYPAFQVKFDQMLQIIDFLLCSLFQNGRHIEMSGAVTSLCTTYIFSKKAYFFIMGHWIES